MSRTSVVTRVAGREDAPVLAELWGDLMRRADRAEQVADLELVIKDAAASPEKRLVVAEVGGQVAGAIYLRLGTVSPINLEPCVQSVHPRVFDHVRRHGAGRALVEAAAAFAEESGVLHLATAVPAQSRDANRFMARIGLAPVATYRVGPTSVVRSRITPQRTAEAGAGRNLSKVLATRRSQRRARGGAEIPPSGDQPPVAPE